MGHAPPAPHRHLERPVPLLLIGPARRRELERRAWARYDESLEGLYWHWAYWNRRYEELMALPWLRRRQIRSILGEAKATANAWLGRIREICDNDESGG